MLGIIGPFPNYFQDFLSLTRRGQKAARGRPEVLLRSGERAQDRIHGRYGFSRTL